MDNYVFEGRQGGLDVRYGEKECECGCKDKDREKDKDCGHEKRDFCKVISENKRLAGVKFELRAKCGCLIACGKTNECGEIKFHDLPFGTYFLVEVEPQKGWQCDNKPICVEICEDNPHKCVEVFNKRNIGSIKVIKCGKEEKFVCEKEKKCGCDED